VQSSYGEEAYDVRLLAQALDASGALGRRSFEIGALPAAAQCRVSVWAFTIEQGAGWQ
jgi:hypothetical protein